MHGRRSGGQRLVLKFWLVVAQRDVGGRNLVGVGRCLSVAEGGGMVDSSRGTQRRLAKFELDSNRTGKTEV